MTLQAGDNITFVCIGDNAAVIAWYQSNRLVTLASRDVSLKFDRDYDANRQTALLTRAGVLGDAAGDYQCRDQNHHIGNSRIIRLQVVAPAAEQSVNNSMHTKLLGSYSKERGCPTIPPFSLWRLPAHSYTSGTSLPVRKLSLLQFGVTLCRIFEQNPPSHNHSFNAICHISKGKKLMFHGHKLLGTAD